MQVPFPLHGTELSFFFGRDEGDRIKFLGFWFYYTERKLDLEYIEDIALNGEMRR